MGPWRIPLRYRSLIWFVLATHMAVVWDVGISHCREGSPGGSGFAEQTSLRGRLAESNAGSLELPPSLSLDSSTPSTPGEVSVHDGLEDTQKKAKKSLAKAAVLSALLPGAGEWYGEDPGKARTFLIAEAAVWATYTVFLVQGRLLQDDCRLFSIAHAGANSGRGDEDYFRAIEEYRTTEEYNEDVRREARKLYPYDDDAREAYITEHLFGEEDWWEWKGAAAWGEYRSLRGRSREAFHRAAYCTAAALANRLISAVDAVMTVRMFNRGIEEPSSLRLEVEPTIAEPGIRVGICYTY